jgi:hypothetical protein
MNDDRNDTRKLDGQTPEINAQSHDDTFNYKESLDLSALAKELSELRQAMRAGNIVMLSEAVEFGRVADAEMAAIGKTLPSVFAHLNMTGEWTMDFAIKTGKNLVIAAIKQSRCRS